MGRLLNVIVVLLSIFFAFKLYNGIFKVVPTLNYESVWWGSRDPEDEDRTIQPFKINVSDMVLKDLSWRLSKARPFTPPLEGTQHQYGLNTKLLQEIVHFWLTKYNWREREILLNQYPQFTVSIQGLRIHYLHVKPVSSQNLTVLPLLMLHGWPESIKAFYNMIPILTTPQEGRSIVFEVIVASLPGFGFSEPAVRPGLGGIEMAVVFGNFMQRLGFEKYYLHGGDWGAMITQHLAIMRPDAVLGLHTNMCFVNNMWANIKLWLGSFYPSLIVSKKHQHKVYPLTAKYQELIMESGYLHIQATKPDTIGVALNDSPVGLLAYILEKYITFTNPALRDTFNGGLDVKFTYTHLLDNVMIYWITNSITTSMRLYSESFNKRQFNDKLRLMPITVPSACARFPYEVIYHPTTVLRDKFKNLVQVTDFDDGGHFAASEYPDVLANDIFKAFEKIEQVNEKNRKEVKINEL